MVIVLCSPKSLLLHQNSQQIRKLPIQQRRHQIHKLKQKNMSKYTSIRLRITFNHVKSLWKCDFPLARSRHIYEKKEKECNNSR